MSSKARSILIGRLSLAVAILAYFPSMAPFTPAIVFSMAAFIGAMLAARGGGYRTACLTAYIVIATFLAHPIFGAWLEPAIKFGTLLKLEGILGLAMVITLLCHYKFKR